jgi:hypothetical protein
MHLPRKSLVGLIVIAALFGATTAPAAGMSGAATGLGHAPIIHIATIPAGIRQRRRRRGARARSIAWRAVRRMGGVRRMVRMRRETLQPRVPPHESLARGPPRTDSRRCRNGAAMRRPAFASAQSRGRRMLLNRTSPDIVRLIQPGQPRPAWNGSTGSSFRRHSRTRDRWPASGPAPSGTGA